MSVIVALLSVCEFSLYEARFNVR